MRDNSFLRFKTENNIASIPTKNCIIKWDGVLTRDEVSTALFKTRHEITVVSIYTYVLRNKLRLTSLCCIEILKDGSSFLSSDSSSIDSDKTLEFIPMNDAFALLQLSKPNTFKNALIRGLRLRRVHETLKTERKNYF